MAASTAIVLLIIITLLPRSGRCKECTNAPTSSHTIRHALLSSENSSHSISEADKFSKILALYGNSQPLETPEALREAVPSFGGEQAESAEYSAPDHRSFVSSLRLFGGGHVVSAKKQLSEVPTQRLDGEQSFTNQDMHTRALQVDKSIQASLVVHGNHEARVGTAQCGPAGRRADYIELAPPRESFLKEVSLHDVVLHDDHLHGRAQQTNLEYLLMLDVDRLVWSFRKTANLSTIGLPYGGWESPTSELRGHFVGHYLSASSHIWASTHNWTIHTKMTAVVEALFECQQAVGSGYLSAFPSEFFDRFEVLQPVWAPYYTIHKIMAGLLDQYTLGDNSKALEMAIFMADYFNERVLRVIKLYTIERHWQSLNEETGGMNDVLYRLYTLTDNPKYRALAHLFDKPCFLGLLAVGADSLSGFHANTHIPLVVGAQMRFEVTGEKLYKDISSYFLDIVSTAHSYPTGGTSAGEFWTDAMHLGETLGSTETEESCTTYNMLKVSRHLFRWTRQMKYADYYERALTNGVLSIQRGQDPGVMIYMLPMGKGQSKAVSYHGWGTQFDSFWCCYGTGIESFSKLGDSIYFEDTRAANPCLYILQFISSSLRWQSVGFLLHQHVEDLTSSSAVLYASLDFMEIDNVKGRSITVGEVATLRIRIPFWVESLSGSVLLNNKTLNVTLTSGEFLQVTRIWQVGDKLELVLPVRLWSETVKDSRPAYQNLHAIFYGPYLLAGLSNGDWDITGVDIKSLTSWVVPVDNSSRQTLFSLTQEDASGHVNFLVHNGSTLSMGMRSVDGSNEAAYSTFKMVDPMAANLVSEACLQASLTQFGRDQTIEKWTGHGHLKNLTGKVVSIELYDQPGIFLMHSDTMNVETVRAYNNGGSCAMLNFAFRTVSGLRSPQESVSFEALSKPGCFLYADPGLNRTLTIECMTARADKQFQLAAATFSIRTPPATYHSMSFIAKGLNKDYLLFPLMSFKDENYTVFFNVTSESVSGL